MPQFINNRDEIKRKLRELKKIEIKMRFQDYELYNNKTKSSKEMKNVELVWNQFFTLKEEAVKNVKYRIIQFGKLNTPVLISGESGTGKELVARAIHRNSKRADKPFIAVNCGGLPPTLIESELFGHTQGSFTGAAKTKNGLIDAAEGGTLFLDEIGELPLTSQSVFLRILDSGEYYRIGESVPLRADVRIVSATNRSLEVMIEEGKFRNDLFYRIKGSCIHLPPLRKRKEDIPELINHFLKNRYRISQTASCCKKWIIWYKN